jgi:indolepyruvate ferredoxin oxidoreductase, beta subunit
MADTINVMIVGIGGQGVLKTSEVLAEAAVRHGYDVKQSEVHGMSQRGGSVSSEVRFGVKVASPLTPAGEVDFLLGLNDNEVTRNAHLLRAPKGAIVVPPQGIEHKLADARAVNMVILGQLSKYLQISRATWEAAIRAKMPAKAVDGSIKAFELGASA